MNDNTKSYKTQFANDFLVEEDISYVDLHIMSPDVNHNEPNV